MNENFEKVKAQKKHKLEHIEKESEAVQEINKRRRNQKELEV